MVSVYDAFLFNGETDLLEFRLKSLEDVVDWFVIVESSHTFQGDLKDNLLDVFQDRLAPWRDRIRHISVGLPRCASTWDREAAQRNALREGFSDARPADVVLLSDVDEIPKASVVRQLPRKLEEPLALEMGFFYYNWNLRVPFKWRWGRASRARDAGEPQALRSTTGLRRVIGAGWHCSYMGDAAWCRGKLRAFSHHELADEIFASEAHIARCQSLHLDFAGRFTLSVENADHCPPVSELCPHLMSDRWATPLTTVRRLQQAGYLAATRDRSRQGASFVDSHPVIAAGRAILGPRGRSRARERIAAVGDAKSL